VAALAKILLPVISLPWRCCQNVDARAGVIGDQVAGRGDAAHDIIVSAARDLDPHAVAQRDSPGGIGADQVARDPVVVSAASGVAPAQDVLVGRQSSRPPVKPTNAVDPPTVPGMSTGYDCDDDALVWVSVIVTASVVPS